MTLSNTISKHKEFIKSKYNCSYALTTKSNQKLYENILRKTKMMIRSNVWNNAPLSSFHLLSYGWPLSSHGRAFLLKELTACWTGLSGPPFFAFPHRHWIFFTVSPHQGKGRSLHRAGGSGGPKGAIRGFIFWKHQSQIFSFNKPLFFCTKIKVPVFSKSFWTLFKGQAVPFIFEKE